MSVMRVAIDHLDESQVDLVVRDTATGRRWQLQITAPRAAGNQPEQQEVVALRRNNDNWVTIGEAS